MKSSSKKGVCLDRQDEFERPSRFSELPELMRRALGSWWPGAEPMSSVTKRRVPAFRRHFALEAMEPRVLLSADPVTVVAAGVLTATFSNADDVVDIKLASTLASDNGGVIVNLKYNGADHLFGTATD